MHNHELGLFKRFVNAIKGLPRGEQDETESRIYPWRDGRWPDFSQAFPAPEAGERRPSFRQDVKEVFSNESFYDHMLGQGHDAEDVLMWCQVARSIAYQLGVYDSLASDELTTRCPAFAMMDPVEREECLWHLSLSGYINQCGSALSTQFCLPD